MVITISELMFVEKLLLGLLLVFIAEIIGFAYDGTNKSLTLTTIEETIVGGVLVIVLLAVGFLARRLLNSEKAV